MSDLVSLRTVSWLWGADKVEHYRHDLVHLSSWGNKLPYIVKNDRKGVPLPYRRLDDTELPASFCFDKFGLLIRTEGRTATLHGVVPSPGRERTGLAPLLEVIQIWGTGKAERYGWADEGSFFCTKLRTAAPQSGRLGVSSPVNLIIIDDLVNLKSWYSKEPYVRRNDREGEWLPFRRLDVTELPAGLGLDEFGLVMGVEASAAPEVGAVPRSGPVTRTVGHIWGADKVKHYGWAEQTPTFETGTKPR
ncbi:hypothetical protein F5883DRAFT_653384 [Diaporthe sp. PMI_573]|nr:hypothetical protein F5883DRAFT_653384 [Diaporthaceae sp. PMI_573]